jgi:hypothetical protein
MPENPAFGVKSDVLVGMLAIAVMGEMANVTDASMEMFLADRDRYWRLGEQADALAGDLRKLTTIGESDRTEAHKATMADLRKRIDALYRESDSDTILGLITSHSDEMMYGGKHCTKTFAAMARALAHLAQNPGGVGFAGLHWCAGSGHQATAHPTPCDAEVARGAAA